ncbi:MAG TPA: MFS transporter, partial [Candidatus Baltobacteraceae bacterium]|nr:MFS transporter [Candidatus Baltobacteraceae bacterium]
IVPPIAGAVSDKLRRAGVPRRAVIWTGVAVDMAALVVVANVHTLAAFILFVLVATFGANISLAAFQAMIPDVVPQEQWGLASGIRNVATLVGVILGFAVSGWTTVATTFIAVAIALGVFAAALLGQPEKALPNQTAEERAHVSDWHDFSIVFLARFFLAFGLALLMTFVLYFFRDILHVTNASTGTAYVGFASLGGAIISGIYLGWLSDRVERKLIVALCGVPMTLAAAGFALFPNEHWMYGFSVLFGIGFGGIMSTGWALAIDSVPKMRDVARDLGIWGIAQNLPQVIAPLAGGFVLARFNNTEPGYQTLFFAAAGCFALGSVTVLAVGRKPLLPWWGFPIRVASAASVWAFTHLQNRVRGWGALPRKRPPALVISNHQIDLDLMEPFANFILTSAPENPVLSVSARLMYEPGFMALRVPWLAGVLSSANLGWMFDALGMLPLENELQTRSVARWTFALQRRHGVLPLDAIFKPAFLETNGLTGISSAQLFTRPYFAKAQSISARLTDLQTAYRKEVFDEMRAGVEADLQRIERAMQRGATMYVTPEGEYTSDGKMRPFRGIWDRLEPHAQEIYLCAISYDPLRTGKFSQMYQIVPLRDRARVVDELKAARPVTVSAILARWLLGHSDAYTGAEAVNAVCAGLEALPPRAFVDPEFARDPRAAARDALAGLRKLNGRRHPRFEETEDILSQQAAFLDETIAACLALGPNEIGPSTT